MLGIYCRTSKSRLDKYTLENQRDGGIDLAKKIGLPYEIYEDDGISGTKGEAIRDGLFDLFSAMKKGTISAIYVIHQDRIERDPDTWKVFVWHCLNYKIKYYPGGSYCDLDNPTNRMFTSLMSIFNAHYAEMTSIKVRIANASKAAAGKTHGLKPYGYRRDLENKYEIYDVEAKHVLRMFELSLNGNGAYTIANILNSEGVPTKFSGNFKGKLKRKDNYRERKYKYFNKEDVKWRGNVISDILKNPIYKGKKIWRRHENKIEFIDDIEVKKKYVVEEIESEVPAIVSQELWEKVQLNFKTNKEKVGRRVQYHYLLNGLIYCEKCGQEYRGKKRIKGNDNAYKCCNKIYPNPNCDNRGLSIPRLETFVIHYLQRRPSSSVLMRELRNSKTIIEENKPEELLKRQKKLQSLNKTIKKLVLALNDEELEDIAEIRENLISYQKIRKELVVEIELLRKVIEAEIIAKENEEENIKTLKKIKLGLTPKINQEFDSIKKAVFDLVEWISIKHKKLDFGGEFEIKIKLKTQWFADCYRTDWKLEQWEQVGYYAINGNDKKASKIDLGLINDSSPLEALSKLVKITPKEAGRAYNNLFLIKDKDLYNFD
jgi:DNA invertase Pin-like site-specific DNA recombinase